MNEMHTLQVNGQEFALADAPARERLDTLERCYRHIATREITEETQAVKQIEITADQAGEPFSCSSFMSSRSSSAGTEKESTLPSLS